MVPCAVNVMETLFGECLNRRGENPLQLSTPTSFLTLANSALNLGMNELISGFASHATEVQVIWTSGILASTLTPFKASVPFGFIFAFSKGTNRPSLFEEIELHQKFVTINTSWIPLGTWGWISHLHKCVHKQTHSHSITISGSFYRKCMAALSISGSLISKAKWDDF